MWSLFRNLQPEFRNAVKAAKQCVADSIESAVVRDASLRADEAERWVFAVFYTRPKVIVRPTPYRIVGVSKSTNTAEELPHTSDSPYWIRNRK